MGWRWRKVINLGGGLRANLSRNGLGWSWGIPGFRVGKGSTGSLWFSVGFPGTGVYFIKKLGKFTRRGTPQHKNSDDDKHRSTGIKRWNDLL